MPKFKRTNQSSLVSKISQIKHYANNINTSFDESKEKHWSFDEPRNALIKNGIWTVKSIFLRRSEVSEKKKVVYGKLSTK